jgi:hypothetical protein
MRTTIDIDADILKAARVLAVAEHKTLGQVLSDLVRKGLAESAEGLGSEAGLSRALGQGGAAQRGRPGGR